MNIYISHSVPPATVSKIPDFPLVRFDTGLVVYEEALINGQYLGANWSAMGRPKSREQIWRELSGGAASTRPLRRRQHAFQLQIDGQSLADRWQWIDGREEASDHSGCRQCVVTLRHMLRPINEAGEWCVLEYAAPDASKAYAGIFRLAGAQSDTFHFRPKGLSVSRRYKVTFDNSGQSRDLEGFFLLDSGLRVRVPGGFQSELLLFEAI